MTQGSIPSFREYMILELHTQSTTATSLLNPRCKEKFTSQGTFNPFSQGTDNHPLTVSLRKEQEKICLELQINLVYIYVKQILKLYFFFQ